MKKTAIIYTTISGSTKELAYDIADRLSIGRSHVFDLLEMDLAVLNSYETILLGSPTYGKGKAHYLWKEGLQDIQGLLSQRISIGLFVMGDMKNHRPTFGKGIFELYKGLDLEKVNLIGTIPRFTYKYEFLDWEETWLPGLIIDKHGKRDRNKVCLNTWIERIHVSLAVSGS